MPDYADPNDRDAYPIKVIQVLREDRRIGEGVEFTGGEIVIRWATSGERVSFANREAFSTEIKALGLEAKALTVPPTWWKPGPD